jgi:hypothetical protein
LSRAAELADQSRSTDSTRVRKEGCEDPAVLTRQNLDLEGRSYLHSYLEANARFGKQLGALLIEHYDITDGSLSAYVPSPLPSTRPAPITEFEYGGLYPRRDPEWAHRFGEWLASLARAGATDAFLEGANESPSDGFLRTYEWPVFFCGQSVLFHSSLSGSTLNQQLGLGGAIWRPDISIVTGLTGGLPSDRTTIDHADLVGLVERTLAVIVGAWDEEGLVFWEPRSGPS